MGVLITQLCTVNPYGLPTRTHQQLHVRVFMSGALPPLAASAAQAWSTPFRPALVFALMPHLLHRR